jgi:predicted Fe-Mo cluster-binding NifX family protein
MLACIPTRGNAGREDTVFDHFGSAPYFTLYNSETDEVTVLENRNEHHSHGTCHPMAQLTRYRINCVICSGMGRRAIEVLNSEGIKIYHSPSSSVGEIIAKLKTEDLVEMDPLTACRGHGQGHGMGMGHGNCGGH